MTTNKPMVLVEFTPEEIKWLADRLHEMRSQWNAAAMMGATTFPVSSPEGQVKLKAAILEIEEHKKMEARLRNRILDKADDQGFGNL